MKATKDTVAGLAFIVLYKSGFPHEFIEPTLGKRLEEISAMITEHLRLNDYNTVNCSLYNFHSLNDSGILLFILSVLFGEAPLEEVLERILAAHHDIKGRYRSYFPSLMDSADNRMKR